MPPATTDDPRVGTGVLVALHGHGDEPADARRWGHRLAPPGWDVVAPGAPVGDDGVRSWFEAGSAGADGAALDDALRRIGDVVARVRAGGRRVVVAGHSQGGAVAMRLATVGTAADAIVALGAFWADRVDEEPLGGAEGVDVLVVHGSDDDVVPVEFGADAAALLESLGARVEVQVMPAGHDAEGLVAQAATRWIRGHGGSGPRVSLGLPVERVGTDLVTAAGISSMAATYERLGFDAAYVTDHPAPDERWLAAGGHHALEPSVALTLAAAATSRMAVHTNVYILGYRNPFLAAKTLASLDVASDGRLIVGVAAGYLRPEFAALGAEFESRGERLSTELALLPRIWSGEVVEATGEGWSARSVRSLPVPVQSPHPPIWVGGNSTAAIRRAVRHGEGWCPFPTPPGAAGALRTAAIEDVDQLRLRLGRAQDICEEVGRDAPLTTCFVPFSLPAYLVAPDHELGRLAEEVAELGDLGIDWVALMAPGSSCAEVADRAAELAAALGRT